jgi:hypothetical protein
VLTLAVEDAPSTVSNYMRQRKYSFPVVLASEDVVRAFGVPYFPFKVVVAPDGRYLALPNETWESEARDWLRAPVIHSK